MIYRYTATVLQYIFFLPVRIILRYFLNIKITGLSHIDNLDTIRGGKGLLVASNHTSQLDSLIVPTCLPYITGLLPWLFVSKGKGNYERFPIGKHIYGGWLFDIFGCVSVTSGTGSYAEALSKHLKLINAGSTMLIYPEGRVTLTEKTRQVHGGIGYLALESRAPVLPIFLSGHQGITFIDFLLRKRKVEVHIGKPQMYDKPINIALEPASVSKNDNVYKSTSVKIMDNLLTRNSRGN